MDGIDLDDAFVEIARKKLSRGDVFHDDMSTFAVQRQCDVILCLFSSIGYARALDRVRQTLTRFREHLAPGGIVIVEPWFAPGGLEHGRTTIN